MLLGHGRVGCERRGVVAYTPRQLFLAGIDLRQNGRRRERLERAAHRKTFVPPVGMAGARRGLDDTDAEPATALALQALNLINEVLICDRDAKWSAVVRDRLREAGIRVVQTPYQAPNANSYAERFVRSVKEECLDRMIPLGERSGLHQPIRRSSGARARATTTS